MHSTLKHATVKLIDFKLGTLKFVTFKLITLKLFIPKFATLKENFRFVTLALTKLKK